MLGSSAAAATASIGPAVRTIRSESYGGRGVERGIDQPSELPRDRFGGMAWLDLVHSATGLSIGGSADIVVVMDRLDADAGSRDC